MTELPTFETFRDAALADERALDLALRGGHFFGETTERRYRYVGPPAAPTSEHVLLERWLDAVGTRCRARAERWLCPLHVAQSVPDEESISGIRARLAATTAILAQVDVEALAARLGLYLASREGA